MKIFNKDTKNIIGTLAMIFCLLRLVEMEENALAKVLEILLVIYRILIIVDSVISKFNFGNGAGDTTNTNNDDNSTDEP